jgi:hypothetical protein
LFPFFSRSRSLSLFVSFILSFFLSFVFRELYLTNHCNLITWYIYVLCRFIEWFYRFLLFSLWHLKYDDMCMENHFCNALLSVFQ